MSAKDELLRVWSEMDRVGFPNSIPLSTEITLKDLRRELLHRLRKGYKRATQEHPQKTPLCDL